MWSQIQKNMLLQFSIISFCVMLLLATLILVQLSEEIKRNATDSLVSEAVGTVSGRLLRRLENTDLQMPMTGERYEAMDQFVTESIASERTARIKLWGPGGLVVYSSDPASVGDRFPDNESYLSAWAGTIATEVKVADGAENERERHLGTLLEVYTPLIFEGESEPAGVLEIYQYYGPTADLISRLQLWVSATVGAGFLLLYLSLVSIVARGWRTIVGQRRQLRRANHRMANQVAQLDQEVQRRTRIQTELEVAHREAEAASRAKSEFLATMSHELRTPLTGVLGMTELLETTDLDREQQCYAADIRSSSAGLVAIINDILDYTRIEAGRVAFVQEIIESAGWLERTCAPYRDLAASKGIEFVLKPAPDLPDHIQSDSEKLSQILCALLSNAVKFTEEGRIEVIAEAAQLEGGKGISISVTDTGIGIPEGVEASLFHSFYQGDGSYTRRFGGIGLGLAIGRRLCLALGGDMWVESGADGGSTFTFTVLTGSDDQPIPRAQPRSHFKFTEPVAQNGTAMPHPA